MSEGKRLNSLNQLRGIAAVLVVFSHIGSLKTIFGSLCGSFAVDLFFLMSGFLMVLSTERTPKNFLLKKVVRLLPMYYLMTLVAFFSATLKPEWFNTTNPTLLNLLRSLLFIPYQNPNGLVRPILEVGWYLNVQILVYLVFWLAMKFSLRYRVWIASAVLLVGYVIGSIVCSDNAFFILYKGGLLMSAVGMILFVVYHRINQKSQQKKYAVVTITMCFVTLVSGFVYSLCKENSLFIVTIVLPVLVFCAFIFLDPIIYEVKVLDFLSSISLTLYLTHVFIVKGVSRLLFSLETVSVASVIASVICVVAAIVFAYVMHWVFELHLNKKLFDSVLKSNNRKE